MWRVAVVCVGPSVCSGPRLSWAGGYELRQAVDCLRLHNNTRNSVFSQKICSRGACNGMLLSVQCILFAAVHDFPELIGVSFSRRWTASGCTASRAACVSCLMHNKSVMECPF